MTIRKALFLDRDGVVNVDRGYVHKKEDFEFCDGIFEFCKFFKENSFEIVIVTNQSGIARQYFTEQDFQNLNNWMLKEFQRNGVLISAVYHCPHLPTISGPCDCRKPKAGLVYQAINDLSIAPEASIFIGDRETDMLCAKRANIGLKILVSEPRRSQTTSVHSADYVINSFKDGLGELKKLILSL